MKMKNDHSKAIMGLGCVAVLLILVFVVTPATCQDAEGARRVLTQNGYTNIRTTGYRFFGGGKDDVYKTGFEATSPTGQRVTGMVSSGILKSHTIRFD